MAAMTGKIKQTRQRVISVLLLGVLGPAYGDAEDEREALAQIVNELKTLAPLVRRAQAHADTTARIRFRYDWLTDDLERIRQGVKSHLNSPRIEPRSFPPLKGDYRR